MKKFSVAIIALFLILYILPLGVWPISIPDESRYAEIPRETMVVSDEYLVHAVCWVYGRDNVYLLGNSGELRYGLERDESNPSRLLTIKEFREIINRNSGKHRIVLIAEEKRYRQWMSLLPNAEFEDIDNGFVFLRF